MNDGGVMCLVGNKVVDTLYFETSAKAREASGNLMFIIREFIADYTIYFIPQTVLALEGFLLVLYSNCLGCQDCSSSAPA